MVNTNFKDAPNKQVLSNKELRFALLFMLVFCMLQYAYATGREGWLEHMVIDIATVYPSAAAINLIDPGVHAIASAHRILSPQGSISVLNGCEGTETLFLLIAAVVAFRAPITSKLNGLLLGTILVYGLNQLRIIALFFAAQENRKWFDMLHGYIAPGLIILLSSLFFLWWTGTVASDESAHPA